MDPYGARVLAEPPRTGLNWLIYILPPLIILAGAFLLFRALRAWTRPSGTSAAAGSVPNGPSGQGEGTVKASRKEAPKDEYVARLEEELKKRN